MILPSDENGKEKPPHRELLPEYIGGTDREVSHAKAAMDATAKTELRARIAVGNRADAPTPKKRKRKSIGIAGSAEEQIARAKALPKKKLPPAEKHFLDLVQLLNNRPDLKRLLWNVLKSTEGGAL